MIQLLLMLNTFQITMANTPIVWDFLGLFTMTNCQPGFEHHCLDAQWTAESLLTFRGNGEEEIKLEKYEDERYRYFSQTVLA